MRSASTLPVPHTEEQTTRKSRLYQKTKVQPKSRERSKVSTEEHMTQSIGIIYISRSGSRQNIEKQNIES